MSRPTPVYQWAEVVGSHFPQLSQPQVMALALLSLGMALARTCSLSTISLLWASWEARKANTVRQRLREWCYDAPHKRGAKRREVEVSACFAPLLRWVLQGYQGKQLAIAMDASSLGDRFVVLALSVVVRGCAIPVAWTIVPAGTPGAWRPHWLRLFDQVRSAAPEDGTVIVLADRGLYARWLFQHIVRVGWHPFLRINTIGGFRPDGEAGFRPFRSIVAALGTAWAGSGTAFASRESQLRCTLLACWEEGYQDPWLVLTDLPPQSSAVCWYGMRAWIEHGFKLSKRGGWQWHRTRMTDPARAERLWLAMAVATLWVVRVGGAVELEEADCPLGPVGPGLRAARRRRAVSLFQRGWITILVALLTGKALPQGVFAPDPWPTPQALVPPAPKNLPL